MSNWTPRPVALLAEDEDQVIRLIARRPRVETEAALDEVDREIRELHGLSDDGADLFPRDRARRRIGIRRHAAG